jgi:hypothetical protein
MLAICLSLILALALFFALSQPLELRERRWSKIGGSLVLVLVMVLIDQSGLGYGMILEVFLLVVLCFMWMPHVAHCVSALLVNTMFGGFEKGSLGGFRPDYREARIRIEAGDLDAAIELVQHEIGKAPTDFEGRSLMAALYHEKKQPRKALVHLEAILNDPQATDSQKQAAAVAKAQCLELQQYLAITKSG